MKFLDKFLRQWRISVAMRHVPETMEYVYDIGCDDGYLINQLKPYTTRQDGVDPCLGKDLISSNSSLKKGYFPSVIDQSQMQEKYNAIFALAVIEHFSENDILSSGPVIAKMLSPKGRLIISVPHPFVDKILHVLSLLNLVDADTLDEHHGFDPALLPVYLADSLKLVKHKKFQLGLNNIYVFERY